MKTINEQVLSLELEIKSKQKELDNLKTIERVHAVIIELEYAKLSDSIRSSFRESYSEYALNHSDSLSKDAIRLFLELNSIDNVMTKIPINFILTANMDRFRIKLDIYELNHNILNR